MTKHPHLLVALLAAGAIVSCGLPGAGPSPTPPAVHTSPTLTADARPTQDQPLSTADYKVVAGVLYRERAAIDAEMTTLANENATAATRVQQINDNLLPELQRLQAAAEAAQPADPSVADLHRHLLNSLQLTISAYQDFAAGLAQNDTAALARGRSELTAQGQELAIWVHGVPTL